MPKTIKKRSAAQRTRKSTDAGKNKKEPGCQGGNRNASTAPRVISNSIFALTLKDRPAIEIVEKMDVRKHGYAASEEDDYMKMYRDLLVCFQNAVRIVKNDVTTFDPFASGLDIGVSLSYVLKGFESNILPKGCEYNIDKDESGYYFTIYKQLDFGNYWHTFEIKPIVDHLKVHNKKLHDLFVILISSFMTKTDILTWWNGGLGYADYMLQERIECFEPEEYEDDQEADKALDALIDAWLCYEWTDAKEYEELIRAAPYHTPEKMLKTLSNFDSENRTVKWMKAVCEFMKLPGCINDFIYYESEEDDPPEGLKVDQQAAIIWNWDDELTHMQEECIDAEAQGCGVLDGVLNYHFTRHTKSFDINDFNLRCTWPAELHKIHTMSRALIEELQEKQKSQTQKPKRNAKRSDILIDVNV